MSFERNLLGCVKSFPNTIISIYIEVESMSINPNTPTKMSDDVDYVYMYDGNESQICRPENSHTTIE